MKKSILKQLLMLSRYCIYGILIQTIFYSIIMASDIRAQGTASVKEVSISIRFNNENLINVVNMIESSTGFKFSYNFDDLKSAKPVSGNFVGATLYDVLYSISQQAEVKFRQVDENISISSISKSKQNKTNYIEIIQTRTITGRITAMESNEALPGVNVVEMGTSNGTITDVDGRYAISVSEGAVLAFSSVGYNREEISTGNQSVINVVMTPDIQQLQELVVIAYGTQDKKDLTSSISSLKAKDLGALPVASADALLQGKAAGVQVVQNSGQPGGEVFVRIRGTSSLLGESRPLYVIDGVPMTNIDGQPLGGGGQRFSALSDINPNDIESIEILKDAAAAALYGSRGSNGVILITTKKGSAGEARISFDAYYGLQSVSKTFDLLGGQEYIDLLNEARVNSGNAPFDQLTYTGVETNWQDEVFRTAPIANYNISLSGGNERLTSYLSLGYFDQSGTLVGQEFTRLNGRFNLDYKAKSWLKIGTNTTFSNSNTDRVDADLSSYSVFANALFFNPNVPVKNPDGTWGRDPLQSGEVENPVMIAEELIHNITNRRLISNVYGEIQFLKNFKLRSTFGIDYMDRREERFIPSYFIKNNPRGSSASSDSFFDEMVWQNENTLYYGKDIEKHSFGALVGLSFLESKRSFFGISGNTSASDMIYTFAASNINPPNHNISSWGLMSYFGRFNYNYDGKYLVEVSLRRDGSSRFGANNRWGTFPSIAGGYRISAEPFMQGVANVISDMKIRVSYGETGNQDGIDDFGSLTQYSAGPSYNGNPVIYKSAVGNTDLRWESTAATNFGLDMSFWGNRLDVVADYYIRTTNDLFYSLALPRTTGFTQINRVNLGSLENRGVELTLSGKILTGDFVWTADFNIAFNQNEITDLYEFNGESDRVIPPVGYSSVEGPYGLFRIGEPTVNFYGYKYLGIWGDETFTEIPQEWGTRVKMGDIVYEDVNENFAYGRIDDHQLIGNALPKNTGGFTNTFAYKGLDLNIIMNWSYGNDIYNMTRAVMESMSRERNQFISTASRWSPENPNSDLPRAFYGSSSTSGAANTDANSRLVEDGSFLRIRNITLGYSLPTDVINKLGLTNARLYLSGQNLFTFTNYTGLDPENQNLGAAQGGIPSLGVDFLTQPLPRVYTLGINIGF